MWLNLEAGCAKFLRVRYRIAIDAPRSTETRAHGRRALVVEAALTLLPESEVEALPSLAASEVEAGLGGPLRTQIARSSPRDPDLVTLRDELVAQLAGSTGTTGALALTDHVHLARLMHGRVPPIIAASCVAWYGHWRTGNSGPHLASATSLQELAEEWIEKPGQRVSIDQRIIAEARQVVGAAPTELIDVSV